MNAAGRDALETWSARLADGEAIDWEAARAALPAEAFGRLRQLAELAGVMRHCDPSDVGPGDRWGHLEIRGRLGRGSFGLVMLAFDPILQREVALKLRRADGPASDPEAWIHEARQLARVRHPNVLAVHGADIRDGVPGLWADRVEGTTLRDHVRGGAPTFAEALRIARQLAAAVAAVHGHGLVHGDLKPGNVMIEPGGRVVLMDFGSARREGGRRSGAGSPAVMSPERLAGGPASQADDIHALGVVFAFLVRGRYPFEADSVEDLRALHAGRSDVDVDAPGTPRGWRMLLRDMLAREPDSRPNIDSVVDRLERLHTAPARRRRTLAVGSIFGLLLAGLAIALTAYTRVRDAESETSAVNELLRDVLAAPRATELGREARVVDVLERAVPEAERRFENRPLALARVRALAGRTWLSLGPPSAAEPLLRAALATYTERLGPSHPRSIGLLDAIARVEHATGRRHEAEATWNRLLEMADAGVATDRYEMIYAHVGKAGLRMAENRTDAALAELDRALALHVDARTARAAQSARSLKALVLSRGGRLDEAAEVGAAALEESLRVNGRRHVNTLVARDRLIQVRLGRGEMAEAETLARDNLADTLDWLGEGERRTVMAQVALSNVLADRGQVDESLALLEAASAGAPRAFPPDSAEPLVIDSNRAARYLELDRPREAVELATALAARIEASTAPVGPLPWTNGLNRAEGLYWLERHDEALDAALRIHADVLAAHGENHPLARIADSYRAAALNRLGRPEEAAPLLDGAHAALAAAIGGDHPQTLLVEAWQAEAMALSGRHDEAVALMESVLERARAALVPGHYRLRDLDRIAMRIQAAASG
ncbi:MAG: hypothetical protein CMP07_11035 [Xanthomonadales bacterium]|nr:hypothetical protein [Xanthomonadales bacterium]